MDIQGNILDHEYRIESDREKVAEVSKKMVPDKGYLYLWSGDESRQDDALILTITAALDRWCTTEASMLGWDSPCGSCIFGSVMLHVFPQGLQSFRLISKGSYPPMLMSTNIPCLSFSWQSGSQ